MGAFAKGPSQVLVELTYALKFLAAKPSFSDTASGASRARTDDLYRATVALSQLSYSPENLRQV